MTRLPDARGLILIASITRPLDEVIREQLRANAANAKFLEEAETALEALKRGDRVDANALIPELQPLFRTEVQGFLFDAMSYDPMSWRRTSRFPRSFCNVHAICRSMRRLHG